MEPLGDRTVEFTLEAVGAEHQRARRKAGREGRAHARGHVATESFVVTLGPGVMGVREPRGDTASAGWVVRLASNLLFPSARRYTPNRWRPEAPQRVGGGAALWGLKVRGGCVWLVGAGLGCWSWLMSFLLWCRRVRTSA